MSLDSIGQIAGSGLAGINRALGVLGQNVANANTTGYVRETQPLSSADTGGIGEGVRAGVVTRVSDDALQRQVLAAGANVSGDTARQSALAAVDAASGTVGAGNDLSSLVGALRDAYSTLQGDPSNATQQSAVVTAASALATGINTLGQAIGTTRQSIQDQLTDDVTTANTALQSIGTLSQQIIVARANGQSTADLEDQRDAAVQTAANLTGATFVPQANGDMTAFTSSGTSIPLHAATGPLAIATATLTAGVAGPALTIGNQAATLTGGKIGAELDLRDTVLPGLQTSADTFAQNLASSFNASGVPLFTDSTGTVPTSTTAGFAQSIQVNPAVTATPSMVRDGTAAATTAGNTSVIDTVLSVVLATGSGTVASQAADLVATNANLAAKAQSTLTTSQSVQTSLNTKWTSETGVSVDTEMTQMVALQNSYAANGKVIAAVEAMWTQLLDAVQ